MQFALITSEHYGQEGNLNLVLPMHGNVPIIKEIIPAKFYFILFCTHYCLHIKK